MSKDEIFNPTNTLKKELFWLKMGILDAEDEGDKEEQSRLQRKFDELKRKPAHLGNNIDANTYENTLAETSIISSTTKKTTCDSLVVLPQEESTANSLSEISPVSPSIPAEPLLESCSTSEDDKPIPDDHFTKHARDDDGTKYYYFITPSSGQIRVPTWMFSEEIQGHTNEMKRRRVKYMKKHGTHRETEKGRDADLKGEDAYQIKKDVRGLGQITYQYKERKKPVQMVLFSSN